MPSITDCTFSPSSVRAGEGDFEIEATVIAVNNTATDKWRHVEIQANGTTVFQSSEDYLIGIGGGSNPKEITVSTVLADPVDNPSIPTQGTVQFDAKLVKPSEVSAVPSTVKGERPRQGPRTTLTATLPYGFSRGDAAVAAAGVGGLTLASLLRRS